VNFFKAQDQARRYTARLVFLFVVAVIILILLTNLLAMTVFGYMNLPYGETLDLEGLKSTFDWKTFFIIGAAVSTVVTGGSLYKIAQLSAGGRVVAEALDGKTISPNTTDAKERRLLNIVEEMAIASGSPVPPVYLLEDELGINAFAAGYTPGNAVIGITRGALNELNREQLQGVIAHEFSHILNGDMRMNTRLIGILNGILIIGIIGYHVLRSMSGSRHRSGRSSGNGALIALVLGLGLIIIGYGGTLFGNIIKLSVSRQREYLADASAVQFTRNPDGIAGALTRIGGYQAKSYVNSPAAPELSHAFFCNGIHSFFGSLFATHPPLEKRIRRIKPNWNGKFDTRPPLSHLETPQKAAKAPQSNAETLITTSAVLSATQEALNSIERAGQPDKQDIQNAHHLISSLNPTVLAAAREPYGARALIYNLVLSKDPDILEAQLLILKENGDTGIHQYTQKLAPLMQTLTDHQRLPLIDLAMPALRQLSLAQYQRFNQNLSDLISADNKIDLFEWSLQKLLFHYLDDAFTKNPPRPAKYGKLELVKEEAIRLIALLAYAGHKQIKDTESAFAAGIKLLEFSPTPLPAKSEVNLKTLNRAVEELSLLKPLVKPQLLKACVACTLSDGEVTARETELLRAFSSIIDCPLPPLTATSSRNAL
jgi:Zn-dependent protease with chaperone function